MSLQLSHDSFVMTFFQSNGKAVKFSESNLQKRHPVKILRNDQIQCLN